MKKTIIHFFDVDYRNLRKLVQIKLPRNTKKVTGIKVTANATENKIDSPSQEIGWLWLSMADKRDVFFAEIIKSDLPLYDIASYALPYQKDYRGKIGMVDRKIYPITFGNGKAWIDGAKDDFFSIEICPKSTIIEGYYTNTLPQTQNGYRVFIYINIEV